MKNPTVYEIVYEYLKANGYDGLYGEDCGCGLNDIMTCCEDCGNCHAGVKVPCNPEACEADGTCDFHIGPKA
ncbi:MAG: hypothetical protein JRL30_01270 [Deltaproteobacteria bacterium]|nr:hypothetical protein [Deltaproteobacteria bacterium]